MNIFCTGANSYVGESAVKVLMDRGHRIIAYTHRKVDASYDTQFIRVHGQLDDVPRLVDTMKKYEVDAVLHLAAQSSPYVSISVPLETAKVNFMDTVTLLEAARICGVKRVMMFSSDCGAGSIGIDVPVTPEILTKPRTVYGVTKTACEYLARTYNYCYGMSCVTLRIPHIIGTVRVPFEIMTKAIMHAVTGRKLIEPNGLDTPQTYLHVDELGEIITTILEAEPEKINEWAVYNICDYSTTTRELLEYIKELVPEFEYEVGPGYETVNGVESEWIQGPWVCDTTTRDFGWTPKYTFETGVKTFLEAYQEAKADGTLPIAGFIAT